jgi:leader peptidase (prepilin peptidase) / N-methyltransferase
MLAPIFDSHNWAAVPFGFWAAVFFVLGAIVGSFLNVCIHRLPLGQSIIFPPSHCPRCQYAIPWYLNLPLVTWVYLRGRCRNCQAPISVRYFVVELLTALLFLQCWIASGRNSPLLALVYAVLLAGLLVASFIDFEHFIIPDEITWGGIGVGLACSFLVPSLHQSTSASDSAKQSLAGIAVGAGLIYAILRLGKLAFGRYRVTLPVNTRIIFSESAVHLPDRDIPYEDLFYRKSDVIALRARRVELVDRCYQDVPIRLSPERLRIGDDEFDPGSVPHMEALTGEIVLPREAMGLGDVKFMAAIGAFLGWKAVFFSLMASSVLGSVVGVTLMILKKHESSRLPYGPYIAAASALWIFGGRHWAARWLGW